MEMCRRYLGELVKPGRAQPSTVSFRVDPRIYISKIFIMYLLADPGASLGEPPS